MLKIAVNPIPTGTTNTLKLSEPFKKIIKEIRVIAMDRMSETRLLDAPLQSMCRLFCELQNLPRNQRYLQGLRFRATDRRDFDHGGTP